MHYRPLVLSLALLLSTSTLAQSVPDPATATRRVESALEEVADSVNNRVTFESNANKLDQLLSDYQPSLSKMQVDQFRTQLHQLRSEYQRFATEEDLVRLETSVVELEQSWATTQRELADMLPNSRESAIADLRRSAQRLSEDLAKLPADRTAALTARIGSVSAAFEQQVGDADAAAQLADLQEYWQRDTAEYAGWEQEKPLDFATYTNTRSASSNAFGLPKTLEMYQQANRKLEQAKESGGAPAAYVKHIEDIRQRTRANLLGAVSKLVTTGSSRDASDDKIRQAMGLLDESLRVTLEAEKDAEFGALATRTQTWLQAAVEADTSSAEGLARYYERMTVSAKAAWPEMEAQFSVVRGFDPGNPGALKGQLIRIETDNLMGWRFKTGDFPFATTISGMPVAATYDGEVEAAIAEIEAKLGRALGDSDDDGRWTIIAEVTGRMGKMQLRKEVEGDIHDSNSGSKLGTYRGETAETVDAPILRIVAAHIGPLAVARGIGGASADGSLAQSAPAAAGDSAGPTAPSSNSGSWLARTPALFLGLFAAALCFAQARPDSVKSMLEAKGQGALFHRLQPLLPWAGLAVAALAILWLFRSLLIGDLLPAAAAGAAGLYAALPILSSRALLSSEQLAKVRPLGVILAVSSGLAALLHLAIGGSWVV